MTDEPVTPEGVADVLSEDERVFDDSALGRLIRAIEPLARLLLAECQKARALALRCSEQEERIADGEGPVPTDAGGPGKEETYWFRSKLQASIRHLRDIEDYFRTRGGLPEGLNTIRADRARGIYEQISDDLLNGKTYVPTMLERAEKAEARCLELEAALDAVQAELRKINLGQAPASHYCRRALAVIGEARATRATLTPPVDRGDCHGDCGREYQNFNCPRCRQLATPTVETEPRCDACGHEWSRHTSGGMCMGDAPEGSECYCVLFPPDEPLSEGVTEPASSASGGQARDDGLDFIRHHYTGKAERGRRVTIYTGDQGTIVGACPTGAHYLHVLVDGDAKPIILHPSWEITYHDEVVAAPTEEEEQA